MAAKKYLKNNAGTITEESSTSTSAGAADDTQLLEMSVSLSNGVYDPKLLLAGIETIDRELDDTDLLDYSAFSDLPAPQVCVPMPSARMLDCCSTDITRTTLNGVVTWFDGQNWAGSCATNGHVLNAKYANRSIERKNENSFIVSREFITLARKLAGTKNADNTQIAIRKANPDVLGSSSCYFEWGRISAKLVEGPYPKFESVLPNEFENSFIAPETKSLSTRFKSIKNGKTEISLYCGTIYGQSIDLGNWPSNTPDFNLEYFAANIDEGDLVRFNSHIGACCVISETETKLIMSLRCDFENRKAYSRPGAVPSPEAVPSLIVTNVQVYPLREPQGKLKAVARVLLNDCLQLTGLRIYDGVNGLFVSYPNDPSHKGEDYRQLFYPVTRVLRDAVEFAVIAEYRNLTAGA